LQEKVYKTRITDLKLSTSPLTNGSNNDMTHAAWPTPFSVAVSVRPRFMRVLSENGAKLRNLGASREWV